MGWTRRLALVALVLGAAGVVGVRAWRAKDRGSVHRGWAVAESHGCFTCHGVGGHRGMTNPGYGLEDIPPWSGGLMTMYADNEAEIREWIQDGVTKRVRADPEQMKLREGAAIAMPSFRQVLSEGDARGGGGLREGGVRTSRSRKTRRPRPAGRSRSSTAASTATGPRAGAPSTIPDSLKGYVPAWDGPDYAELVRSDDEARQWIHDGRARRLQENPLARFFLDRQKVPMPAYRQHLAEADVDALLAYIRWLRQHPY